jgi:HEAT repeat protein
MRIRFNYFLFFVLLCQSVLSQSVDELFELFPADKQKSAELVSQYVLSSDEQILQAVLLKLEDPQSYENATFLLTALTHFAAQHPEFQQTISAAYLAHLQQSVAWQPRIYLLQQLQHIADHDDIEPITALLKDPNLAHYACRVLVTIDAPACGKALLQAFPHVPEKSQREIIQALHEMSFAGAIDLLSTLAHEKNSFMAEQARSALATLGHPRSAGLLWQTAQSAQGYARITAFNDLVVYTRALLHNGHIDSAQSISLQLIHSDAGAQIRSAALGLYAQAGGHETVDLLWQALLDSNPVIHTAASDVVQSLKPVQVIDRLVTDYSNQPPHTRERLLGLLFELQDDSAKKLARESLQSDHTGESSQAIQVLWHERGDDAAELIFDAADENPDLIPTLQTLFLQESHKTLEEILDQHLGNRSAELTMMCVALAQKRHILLKNKTLNSMLENDHDPLVFAAAEYLGELGTDNDIDRLQDLVKDNDGKIQSMARQSLAVLISRSKDSSKYINQLRKEISNDKEDKKHSAMETLARISTHRAFQNWVEVFDASEPEQQSVLLNQVLHMQPAYALPWLLDRFVHSAEPKALKKETGLMLRLLGRVEQWSDLQKTVYYSHLRKKALSEFRRQIVEGLSRLQCRTARQLLSGCMADSQFTLMVSRQLLEQVTDREHLDPSAVVDWVSGLNRAGDQDRLLAMYDEESGLNRAPAGFTRLFNGENLEGWQGLAGNIFSRRKMNESQLKAEQTLADSVMQEHWKVQNGMLYFDGKGQSLCTLENYHNFELRLEWKIGEHGDSGIYLRGVPQVQIWDPVEQEVGSGGLYNNKENPDKPLVYADMPVGEWNTFRIIMREDTVTVYLNDFLVVDKVKLENYWQRGEPLPVYGPLELQAHNTPLWFRNIYIRELESDQNSERVALFNKRDLRGWQQIGGEQKNWHVDEDILFTQGKGGGWLATSFEFGDFVLDLEFRVPEGGNSGVFLRAPLQGNPAYQGLEIQVLDDYAEKYAQLKPWQYTGSIYATVAPRSRQSKFAGEWQRMRISCQGSVVDVWLNGKEIVHADLLDYGHLLPDHPGLKRRSGHIGLQNHGTRVDYRNIFLRPL